MMNKKEFLNSQKDCADMLGISLDEYKKNLKDIKVPPKSKNNSKVKYNNSILDKLGLTQADLKLKRMM